MGATGSIDEPLIPLERLHRLTVPVYEQMIKAGILGEGDRVELLAGVLVQMTPQNLPHQKVIQRLNVQLVRALSERYGVRCQLPLWLGNYSEPEPDFAVVPMEEADADHTPSKALWVIEVADATLLTDRTTKAALYSIAGVP